MPYITQERRRHLNNAIDWQKLLPGNAGELNYLVSVICAEYVAKKGLKYSVLAEVQSALHGAMDEFNRRIVGPYEDTKIEENGDIAPYRLIEAEIQRGAVTP